MNSNVKKSDLNFSKVGEYVIVRGIRFPNRVNPYSLNSETFIETDLRKMKRVKGGQTRIYSHSLKEGNLNRSATVMIPKQEVFAVCGYGIIEKDLDRAHFFSSDMQKTLTGYGKDKPRIEKQLNSSKDVKKKVDDFLSSPINLPGCVNEICMDIQGNKNNISFIYYLKDGMSWGDRDGVETLDLNIKKLLAIYIKEKFKNELIKDLPVYEYSKNDGGYLRKFTYSEKELDELIKYGIKTMPNDRNLLTILDCFRGSIQKSPELLELTRNKLEVQFKQSNSGHYSTSYMLLSRKMANFINEKVYDLNVNILLAKVLRNYKMKVESQLIARKIFGKILKNYSDPKSGIYNVKPGCIHADIHMRNFVTLLNDCKSFFPCELGEFNRKKINEVFKIVVKESMLRNPKSKLYVEKYLNELQIEPQNIIKYNKNNMKGIKSNHLIR